MNTNSLTRNLSLLFINYSRHGDETNLFGATGDGATGTGDLAQVLVRLKNGTMQGNLNVLLPNRLELYYAYIGKLRRRETRRRKIMMYQGAMNNGGGMDKKQGYGRPPLASNVYMAQHSDNNTINSHDKKSKREGGRNHSVKTPRQPPPSLSNSVGANSPGGEGVQGYVTNNNSPGRSSSISPSTRNPSVVSPSLKSPQAGYQQPPPSIRSRSPSLARSRSPSVAYNEGGGSPPGGSPPLTSRRGDGTSSSIKQRQFSVSRPGGEGQSTRIPWKPSSPPLLTVDKNASFGRVGSRVGSRLTSYASNNMALLEGFHHPLNNQLLNPHPLNNHPLNNPSRNTHPL